MIMKSNAKPHTLSSRTIQHTNQNLAKSVSSPTLQTKIAGEKTEGQHTTAVWRNGGGGGSFYSFLGLQKKVLRIKNFCGKPPLRPPTKP